MRDCIGIYAGKCLTTNKVYVGQASIGWVSRTREHRKGLSRGRHHNVYLQAAWNKYGADNFVWYLLEPCDLEELAEREQYWIETLFAHEKEFGFNIAFPVAQHAPSPLMSAAHKKYWGDLTEDEYAERTAHLKTAEIQVKATAFKQSAEGRAAAREKAKAQWQDPLFKIKIAEITADEEYKKRKAEAARSNAKKAHARTRELWKDPVWRAKALKQVKAAQVNANKALKAKHAAARVAKRARLEALAKRLEAVWPGAW